MSQVKEAPLPSGRGWEGVTKFHERGKEKKAKRGIARKVKTNGSPEEGEGEKKRGKKKKKSSKKRKKV